MLLIYLFNHVQGPSPITVALYINQFGTTFYENALIIICFVGLIQ